MRNTPELIIGDGADTLAFRALHAVGQGCTIIDVGHSLSRTLRRQYERRLVHAWRKPFKRLPWTRTSCPYCYQQLTIVERTELSLAQYDEGDRFAALECCWNCRFWQWHFLTYDLLDRGGPGLLHDYVSDISKLQSFRSDLPASCSKDLAQWLRRDARLWHAVSPRRMELLVADIYRANYADANVVHVGQSGDGGADVLFIDSENSRWLIQVKRRELPTKAEGVETVRSLLGALILRDARSGVVASTADHFTYHAFAATRAAHQRGFVIELVDRHMLNQLLDPLLPATTWREVIEKRFPMYAAQLCSFVDIDQLDIFGTPPVTWPTPKSEIVEIAPQAGLLNPWPRD